jgi:hypothetical protein
MIQQIFNIKDYWEVTVFYNVNYNLFYIIADLLSKIGTSNNFIEDIYSNMKSGKAKAVTYSNSNKHVSIVLFNKHTTKEDYLNSIVHEAEHIKQAILKAYNIEDRGEAPAYTIGYIVKKMFEVFRTFIFK